MSARVIAFMNLKGGVGKTVLLANIAREIANTRKRKALLVDLDPQCSLSNMLLDEDAFSDLPRQNTTHEALYDELGDPGALLDHDIRVVYADRGSLFATPTGARIDLLPGSTEIYKLIADGGALEYNHALDNFLAFIEVARARYDLIFLDTNPSTNIATLCALEAADNVVAPITMDIFAVRGIFMLRQLFSNRYSNLANAEKSIGIWNAVDTELRKNDRPSPAERLLHRKNPELIEFALTNRVYQTGFLSYRGSRRGFVHDFSIVQRRDYFNRARYDIKVVSDEMCQRLDIT